MGYSAFPRSGVAANGLTCIAMSALSTKNPANFLRSRPTKLSVSNGEKRRPGTQREPTTKSPQCALPLTKRLFSSLFAVNYMNPGRPSAIVASAPTFHPAHLG